MPIKASHIFSAWLIILSPIFLNAQEKTAKNVKTLNDIPDEFYNEMTIGISTNTNSALIGGFAFKYLRQKNENLQKQQNRALMKKNKSVKILLLE